MLERPSMGQQKLEDAAYAIQDKKNANIRVILIFSLLDAVVPTADNQRIFPFDTSGTTLDLYFRGYGPGLKTTTTVTILIPALA